MSLMKSFVLILFLQSIAVPCSEEAQINESQSNLIAQETLKLFNEKIYKNGGNSLNRDTVRLTILRSHHDPVMIIWYPYDEKFKNSLLEVKKIKTTKGEKGLYFNKIHTLNRSTSANLSTLINLSNPSELPVDDWKDTTLDGSEWIFEFAAKENGYDIVRSNILHHTTSQKITNERMQREISLNSFGLMLWILSKNGEASIY